MVLNIHIYGVWGFQIVLPCRFAHYEKKVQVYDFLIVELFNVHLHVDASQLPRWITNEEIEENNQTFSVYANKEAN